METIHQACGIHVGLVRYRQTLKPNNYRQDKFDFLNIIFTLTQLNTYKKTLPFMAINGPIQLQTIQQKFFLNDEKRLLTSHWLYGRLDDGLWTILNLNYIICLSLGTLAGTYFWAYSIKKRIKWAFSNNIDKDRILKIGRLSLLLWNISTINNALRDEEK